MLIEGINLHIVTIFWVIALSLFSIIHSISSRIYDISGQRILDSRINYSPDEAYDALEAMGNEGRKLYLRLNIIDFIFPLFFYPSIALTIAYLLQRHSIPEIAIGLPIVPIIGGIADLGENICIRKMLKHFDSRPTRVARRANCLTLTKYFMIVISILIIFILLLLRSL